MSGNAKFSLIALVFFLNGCAHIVDIHYDPATTQAFQNLPLKGAKIYLAPIEDNRPNRDSKDLRGASSLFLKGAARIWHPTEPVVDLFRKALAIKLRNYGITITESRVAAHGTLKGILKVFEFSLLWTTTKSTASIDLELTSTKGQDILWNQNLQEVALTTFPDTGLSKALTKTINSLDSFSEFIPTVSDLSPVQNVDNSQQQQAEAKKEPPPRKEQTPQSGSGSGFFVSKMGHVITNAHVVKNCKNVTIGDNANKQVPAELINADSSNDLALLKLSTLEMASAESQSLIQKLGIVVVPLATNGLLRNEDVRLGEKVLVAGYPFGEFFSNTIKVTVGVVSATRGAGDDSGQFQLDAAVQPGNSGGPIYDSGGNIVGVVISQLDKLKMAKAIGSLPENVNFGIKASTVRQFLISSGLPSKKSERTEEKSTEQLAEIAKNQALMVMCLQ